MHTFSQLLRSAVVLAAFALVTQPHLANAQPTQLGIRAGTTGWSLPLYAETYPEFYGSTRLAFDVEVFLRREECGKWIHEWSIGLTSYAQDVKYLIADAPDRGETSIDVLTTSFSLQREILRRPGGQIAPVRTFLGMTFSPAFLRSSTRWIGWDFDGNHAEYRQSSWSLATFIGVSVCNSIALGRNATATSILSYQVNPLTYAYDWHYSLPFHRLSARVGVGFRI